MCGQHLFHNAMLKHNICLFPVCSTVQQFIVFTYKKACKVIEWTWANTIYIPVFVEHSSYMI